MGSDSDLTLVVVAKDHAGLREFDLQHVDAAETVLIANASRTPLSVIGNHYLDHARTPIVGLVHADCGFDAGALAAFAEQAQTAVCGIVGIDGDLVYRWCHSKPGPVVTLDSCSVFLRRDWPLRFDEAMFDSLHCHVEDICCQARAARIPVIVPEAQAVHRSTSTNGQAWFDEYQVYRQRLLTKWRGMVVVTT